MALGGVATGSMKASEAEMVQGNMTYSGCILMAVAWIKNQKDNHTHAKQASLNLSGPRGGGCYGWFFKQHIWLTLRTQLLHMVH